MHFIEIADIQSGKKVLINVNYIETITEESYGTVINLALQAPDCNEKNSYIVDMPLDEVKKKVASATNSVFS